MKQIVNCKEIQKMLKEITGLEVTPETIRSYIIRGILPGTKVGRDWIGDENEIRETISAPGFVARLPKPGQVLGIGVHCEIRHLLSLGKLSGVEIAAMVGCSPSLVSQIKNGYRPY